MKRQNQSLCIQLTRAVLVSLMISILSTSMHVFTAEAAPTAFISSPPLAGPHSPAHWSASVHGEMKNADWTPILDDEFNEQSLNTGIWNVEDYSPGRYQNCCLKFGLQYYTPQAISLKDGALRITSNNIRMDGKSYTSGALTTENKFRFLYGRIDIRARLPKGQGMWPALWLLDSTASYEIDMIEMVNDPTVIYQTYRANSPHVHAFFQCKLSKPALSTGFHAYSLVWYPTSLTWYIDTKQTCQVKRSIPHTPMYLLLDAAVGGRWPGPPSVKTVFPQYTDVDYVRVYQIPPLNYCYGFVASIPLQLDTMTIARGGTINGMVTYTNNCTSSFTITNLIIAARAPGNVNIDFPHRTGALRVQPGQSIRLVSSLLIKSSDPPGSWYAFSSFQTPDGKWHPDRSSLVYFTVT